VAKKGDIEGHAAIDKHIHSLLEGTFIESSRRARSTFAPDAGAAAERPRPSSSAGSSRRPSSPTSRPRRQHLPLPVRGRSPVQP